MTTWNQEKMERAWKFACAAHEGQMKPGTETPMIQHVGLVAMETMAALAAGEQVDSPDMLVMCALLHDTIEDTALTDDDLAREFGPEVAAGVVALSKNTALTEREMQLRDSLRRITTQGREVWMVKLADRIANLQAPPSHWHPHQVHQYRREAILIFEALHSASPCLARRLQYKIEHYRLDHKPATA